MVSPEGPLLGFRVASSSRAFPLCAWVSGGSSTHRDTSAIGLGPSSQDLIDSKPWLQLVLLEQRPSPRGVGGTIQPITCLTETPSELLGPPPASDWNHLTKKKKKKSAEQGQTLVFRIIPGARPGLGGDSSQPSPPPSGLPRPPTLPLSPEQHKGALKETDTGSLHPAMFLCCRSLLSLQRSSKGVGGVGQGKDKRERLNGGGGSVCNKLQGEKDQTS